MSLPPGSRVGIYEVVELIGVGGMGEVYRARDSRLDRAVAIKTLPDEFAANPDRLARFEREAKVLAQLNHPHIASIYGLEPGSPVALAMEMAEGETLSHRIQSGPLPIEDTIVIARQIAEALEHAHAKTIVHRDLKPANIKIGPRDSDPHVKVLDFGLAKAMAADAGTSAAHPLSSPTITSPANLTRAGVVLGTASYMAPEQARGRFVDHRADIWAFGCVVFEMLTGRRAFEGDDVADVLARVLQTEPEWALLPPSTPAHVRTLLRRCLRKDPHQRLHSIADARIELEELQSGTAAAVESIARRSTWLPALAGLAIGAAAASAIFVWLNSAPAPAPAPVLRFTMSAPLGLRLSRSPSNGRLLIALSPDGEKLAAVMSGKDAVRRIFVRRFQDTTFRETLGTEGATGLFWAPDSSRLAFQVGANLRQVDLSGGGSREMATVPGLLAGAWSRLDTIAASTVRGPILTWPASGTSPVPTGALPDGVVTRVLPRWLPDGTGFLFVDVMSNSSSVLRLQKMSSETLDVRPIQSSGAGSVSFDYQQGQLLLATTEPSGRTVLTAQPIDAATWGQKGDPVTLAADLNVAFTASNTGTLAYGDNRVSRERFVWLDERGRVTSEAVGFRERPSNFDLSHDEEFLVIQLGISLVLHDIARGVTSPLAPVGSDPIWSPDDREVAFALQSRTDGGIYAMPAFGGERRPLFLAERPVYPEDWSLDGQLLAAVYRSGDAVLIPLSGKGQPIELSAGTDGATIDEPRFSPDAKWLAFGVVRSSGNEVFLTGLPPTGERWQLSVGGGAQPRWQHDGRALYFVSPSGTLMKVDVTLAPGTRPRISAPRAVLETGLQVQPTMDQYSLSRDRKRILVRRFDEDADSRLDDIHVIVNWPALLKTGTTPPE